MRVEFTKMHGVGNDFVVFDAPRRADSAAHYRVFNADGAEVEQCGNGARCIAALLERRGRVRDGELTLDSAVGVIRARLAPDGAVSVDLGVPDFNPRSLPFDAPAEADSYALEVAGQRLEIMVVSLGNPHAVVTVPSVESVPVASLGPLIERHPRFPKRVNAGFLEIVSREEARLRVYERGAGETRSCGTGACAAVAVAGRRGWLAARVRVSVRGGELQVNWAGVGEHIWLTGPVQISFQGHVEV